MLHSIAQFIIHLSLKYSIFGNHEFFFLILTNSSRQRHPWNICPTKRACPSSALHFFWSHHILHPILSFSLARFIPFSLSLPPIPSFIFSFPYIGLLPPLLSPVDWWLRVPLCYLMLEGRKDPSKVGLMYLCTFTLLKLSGERSFGVCLNQPYVLTLPVDVPPFSGMCD